MKSFIVVCEFLDLSYYGIVEKLMDSLQAKKYPYGENQWWVLYESEDELQSYLDNFIHYYDIHTFSLTVYPTDF